MKPTLAPVKVKEVAVRGSGGRWQPGKSGNPSGRRPGSRNASHLRLHEMVLKDAESVLQRVILAALAGDMRAAQLVLDRALPKRICRGVPSLEMPAIKTAEDAVLAMAAIVRAAVSGEISTGEAAELSQVIENFRRMLETSEFDCRLRDLEQRLASTGDEA